MASITRRPDWGRDWRDLFPRRFFDVFDAPETLFSSERPIHVEEFMEEGRMVVKAEIPGVDPDKDVDITVHDGMLDIRAERRQESKTEEKEGYRSEFRYGMFARTIPLPSGAKEEDIEASYTNGVLQVRVPIAEAAPAAKKITVKKG
jgi:HSP20 family protein